VRRRPEQLDNGVVQSDADTDTHTDLAPTALRKFCIAARSPPSSHPPSSEQGAHCNAVTLNGCTHPDGKRRKRSESILVALSGIK